MAQKRQTVGWYARMFQNEAKEESRSGTPSNKLSSILGITSPGSELTTSLSSSRGSSGSDDPYDLTNTRKVKLSRPKINEDIVDILMRNPPSRPRSVALAKYNPLPAITSDSPVPTKSDTSPSEEEFDAKDEPSDEYEDEESTEFVPPTLVRRGTFNIIETNLDNLHVVGSPSESPDPEVSITMDDERQFDNMDTLDSLESPDDRILCQLTIDGIPLSEYLSQERRNTIQKTMDIADVPINSSRPSSSPSSLITHHGSPDSGFSTSCKAISNMFESRLTSSKSNRSTVYEFKEPNDNISIEEGHHIKLPDNNLVVVRWINEQTLLDLIKTVQTIQFQSKFIRVDTQNISSNDLLESLIHWGISQDSVIHLLLSNN